MPSDPTPYIVASDSENTTRVEDMCGSSFIPEIVIGIDIGTSQCSVAVWNGAKVEVLRNTRSRKAMRSDVAFKDKIPAGAVVSELSRDPELVGGAPIFNVKRLIGRGDTDPVLQASKALLPFLVHTLGIGVRPLVAVLSKDAWRSTTLEEVLAFSVAQLKKMAEIQLKHSVQKVVLTVPVSFSRFQIARVMRACSIAGLRTMRVMPEPTAVALLYAQQQQQRWTTANESADNEKIALIFKMGAGFSDVAVSVTASGVSHIRALAGIAVGGEDLLQNTIRHLVPGVDTLYRCRNDKEVKAVGILRVEVQDAIHRLSAFPTVPVNLDLEDGVKIARVLERQEFEHVNRAVFEKCRGLIAGSLRDAKLKAEEVNDVIVVGGCSFIPKVRELVLSVCKTDVLYTELDALEAPTLGVALEGALASGISDPFGSLRLLAIQVTPLGIGIRGDRGAFVPIIPRNTTIPTRKHVTFTTANENQAEALVVVYEGDERKAEDNHLLGFFNITGIPQAPAGKPVISVFMDIDASNMLRAFAGVQAPVGPDGSLPPFMDVRLPNVEDGHSWCAQALYSAYGSSLDLVTLSKKV